MGKPDSKPWSARYADLLERVMAAAVAGSDPKPLQLEMEQLMRDKPKEKTDGTAATRRRARR